MGDPPRLRTVPEGGFSPPPPEPAVAPVARGTPTWIPGVLALALVVCLALLVWSRAELSGRIDELAGENRALHTAVAEQERVISAQQRRLSDVRDSLDALRAALDEPLLEP